MEGEGFAVWVGFDAAGVVRSGAVQDLHQALQRVLQPGREQQESPNGNTGKSVIDITDFHTCLRDGCNDDDDDDDEIWL